MTVVVLIKRSVRAEKVEDFQRTYAADRPKHEGFIAEYLSKVSNDASLHPNLRTLNLAEQDAVTFVNVAFWRTAADFEECFEKYLSAEHQFDPSIEAAPRQRVVLDLTGAVGDVISSSLGMDQS